MCIVADEVGGNILQVGDGHVGGQMFITEAGEDNEAQVKVSVKDKHFTTLGLTLFTGEALMRVIVFSGTQQQAMVEIGIDNEALVSGKLNDYNHVVDYIQANTGTWRTAPLGKIKILPKNSTYAKPKNHVFSQ